MKAQQAVNLRVLELLNQKDVSMNKVANNALFNVSTLISMLNGHSKKSEITTISKICTGLGVTMREFFSSDLFENVNDVYDE